MSNWFYTMKMPEKDGFSFQALVRAKSLGFQDDNCLCTVQVSRFEGRLYPDCLSPCVSWNDGIDDSEVVAWMHLPKPPSCLSKEERLDYPNQLA